VSIAFTQEHDNLRESVRRFLEQRSTTQDIRRLMESEDTYDPAVWKQLAQQMGLPGIAIPEEYGGSGYGIIEQVIILEEMGRALLPAPYFSSAILAATALLESADDAACRELLPGIADGSATATLAWVEKLGAWDITAQLDARAAATADGWSLTGHKTLVLDATTASLVLVVAATPAGPSLFAVVPGAAGMTSRPLKTLDSTRAFGSIEFDATPAQLIGTDGAAAGVLQRTLQIAAVALAAEQAGTAERCLEISVEYSKLRVQYGRPIGSFQALKHRFVDLLLEIETAKSAVYFAAAAAAEGDPELPLVASMAKASASDALVHAASELIQFHGGIGFTWEHDAHLYFRRAKTTEQFLGSPQAHREVVAGLLLDAS
jgi:alkylation response protein AidB-like acyl-CoA dehydrogenase